MEDDPPEYHVLHKCLFIEYLTQLLLSLHVLCWSCQYFEGEVSIVRQECLSEIGELDPLSVLDVEVLHKGLDLSLGVVYLHLKQTCGELKLRDVALAIKVEGPEGIHNVEIWTGLVKDIFFMLNQFETVQQVAEKSIEGGVFLLLFLIVDPQVEAHAV